MIVLATCLTSFYSLAIIWRARYSVQSDHGDLTITTLAAVAIAIGSPVEPDAAFVPPSPWSLAAIGFYRGDYGLDARAYRDFKHLYVAKKPRETKKWW